jgi:hypothetical protein
MSSISKKIADGIVDIAEDNNNDPENVAIGLMAVICLLIYLFSLCANKFGCNLDKIFSYFFS